MSIRVVHVASGREWRGGQRQVWLLARALARRPDVTQVVVTGRGSELARRLEVAGVPTVTPPWSSALDLRALLATLRATNRRSILHAHDSHALTLAGLASFVTGHALVASRRVDVPLRRTGFWRRADRIIAVSAAVQAALTARGVPASNITVVHDGIPVEEVSAMPPEDLRPTLGLPPGTPLVITTGALVGVKDHMTLVRAAEVAAGRRPDLHWAIAGEGHLRASLDRLITELGLRDRVHLLGDVPDAARFVALADLFVMSSIREGLGTAILDAMALGTPVVGTRTGGITELLEDGAGRLVPPRDPAALAAAVLDLLDDPASRTALAARGREAVRRYGDERMAEGVLRVYRSLTSA
ncbi:MAG: glycosyltransferase [Gemmatimonadales bacterium]|nr:MAG: glycosyltransferase [Gemmatimonadales bacterium]